MPTFENKQPTPFVVSLIYDDLCIFEFACASEVFGLERQWLERPIYRFDTCSVDGRAVKASHGLRIKPGGDLQLMWHADIIVIPGWHDLGERPPAALTKAITDAHARGATVLSICSGSFVLAATGLLNGRRATTHWRYAERLQCMYPSIKVDARVLYIDEGRLMTSAGSAAGIDLCLHVVRRDHGYHIANQIARGLVVTPHRDGGQAQFIERPLAMTQRADALAKIMEMMSRDLGSERTVSDWAREAAMSTRTFMRRFKAATGTTPGEWLRRQKLQQACHLLEATDMPIDHVAEQSGLGTAANLRHHFRLEFMVSPQEYRRRFASVPRFTDSGGRAAHL